MRGTRRVSAVLAVSASLLVLITGCAPAYDPSWKPAVRSSSQVALVDAPAPLDAATVGGVIPRRIRNDDVQVQARWAVLPGEDRVTPLVRAAIDAQATTTGVSYTPQVFASGTGLGDRACVAGSTLRSASEILADPALGPQSPAGGAGTAVVCDIVWAAGSYLGERVRVVTGSAEGVTADTSTLLYVDVASGETATARQLWADAIPDDLWTSIVDMLRRQAGSLSIVPVAPPDDTQRALVDQALATSVPTPDGGIVLTFPSGFGSPELTGLGWQQGPDPLVVRVPAGSLSPFGSALMAASSTPFAPATLGPAGRDDVDCTLLPCVALTYDDGPSSGTASVLDALAAHRGAATFFLVGKNVSSYADVIRREVDEGHDIGNHSWSHPSLPKIPVDEMKKELRSTSRAISDVIDKPVRLLRPPYGEYNQAVVDAAGVPLILWDVDTNDWRGPDDASLVDAAVNRPRPGSIVLQHDVQANTVRTVSAVYEGLADRGFVLVNLTQLFGGTLPTSGVYRSGR